MLAAIAAWLFEIKKKDGNTVMFTSIRMQDLEKEEI